MWHHVRITYNIQAPLEVLPLFVACYLDLWHLGLFRDILHVKCSSGQALAWLLWLQCHSCCGSCASFERLLWSQMITQDKSHGCVAKAMTADEERNKGISLCNFARWFIYDSTVLITCWWRLSVIRVMVNHLTCKCCIVGIWTGNKWNKSSWLWYSTYKCLWQESVILDWQPIP